MGIFSSASAVETVPGFRRRIDANGLSIVASDMIVTGDLAAEGVIRIEGRVTGNVTSGGQILLSEGAVVEGDLRTKEAVLGGEVHGTVTAEDRIEVQANAFVHGDLVTPRLLIHEGGRVNGAVRMNGVSDS